jgi:hypothetical protein
MLFELLNSSVGKMELSLHIALSSWFKFGPARPPPQLVLSALRYLTLHCPLLHYILS